MQNSGAKIGIATQLPGAWPWWLAAAFLLVLVLLRMVSGFDGMLGQDSYAYALQAAKLSAWLKEGQDPGSFFWPRTYPFLGAIFPGISPYLAMQLISMLGAFLVLGCGLSLVSKHSKSHYIAVAALLVLVCAAYFLRIELSTMSEMPALGCLMLGIWLFDRQKAVAAMFCLGLAVAMRYQLGLIVLPFALSEMLKSWRNGKPWQLALMLIFMALPFSVEFLLLPARSFEGQGNALGHSFLQDWSPLNFFRREFQNSEGNFSFAWPNLAHVSSFLWHPGFGFPLLFALPAFLRPQFWRSLKCNPLFWGILSYSILLAGLPMQNNRFLLPLAPLFLILTLPYVDAPNWLGKGLLRSGMLILVVLGAVLGIWGNRNFYQQYRLELDLQANLLANRPTKRLYEFGHQAMLELRGLPYPMESLHKTLESQPQKGDLLLCDPVNLAAQWQGLPPHQNWLYLNAEFELKPLKKWPDGQLLYVLE